MRRTLFFDGQKPLKGDLDNMQDAWQNYVRVLFKDIFNQGILLGVSGYDTFPTVVLGTDVNTVKINKFIAITGLGECVTVDAILDNLHRDVSGVLRNTGSWESSKTYYIVARYDYIDEMTSPAAVHPVTGVQTATRREDSYTLLALEVPLSTDVKLAKLTTDSSANIADITYEDTQYYQLDGSKIQTIITGTGIDSYSTGNPITFEEHANAVGHGIVTATNIHGYNASDIGITETGEKHQKYLHSKGITTTQEKSIVSACYASVYVSTANNDDYVRIEALSEANKEAILINQITITAEDLPTATNIGFVDASGDPIAEGYYLIYLDDTYKVPLRSSSVFATEAAVEAYISATPQIFPLWSIKWEANPVSGNPDNYNLLTNTLRDWRKFGNIDKRNISSDVLGSLNSGTALGNRTILVYNAKLLGGNASDYNVSGLTFKITVDGGTEETITFTGTNPLQVNSVIAQLNTITGLAATIDSGYIKLRAPLSLVIGTGTANTTLGFTDGQSDLGTLLREVEYTDEVPGLVQLTYSGNRVVQTRATFGNKEATQVFTYSGDKLISLTETLL